MARHDLPTTIDSPHLDDATLTSVLKALKVTIPDLDHLSATAPADVKDGVVDQDEVTFSWQVEGRTVAGTLDEYARDWKTAHEGGLYITPSVLTWSGVRHQVQVEQTGRGDRATYRLSVLGVDVELTLPEPV
ncbi:hypothetical protein ACWDTQ_32565 [Streptomyces cellulosae]|uniref:Uncharacterized protein n=1 Tax=Streptomyces cellulosae TaxID=1968 RepID=A0ABW6JDN0_STRCE